MHLHFSLHQYPADMGAGVLYSLNDGEEVICHFLCHSGIGYDVECSGGVWTLGVIEPFLCPAFSEYNLYQF